MAKISDITHHCNIRVFLNQISQHRHLFVKIMLPHFSYPSPIRLRSHCRLLHQNVVMYLSAMLRRLQPTRRVTKAHPRALPTKACVSEAAAAIQSSGIKVAIRTPEWIHLRIRTEILAPTKGATLGLAMGREARLMEWSANIWPGAEAPDLRRHFLCLWRALMMRRRLLESVWQRERLPRPGHLCQMAWYGGVVGLPAAFRRGFAISTVRPIK